MTARDAGRSTGRFASPLHAARVLLGQSGRGATLVLVLVAGLGACCALIAGAPARASGESGGSPTSGTPSSGTPSSGSPGESGSTGTTSCPSLNPPNQLALVAGTPQTALLQTAFAGVLQAVLTNSDGCAVTGAAGIPVTFTAPASGASGVFSASASNTVTVGADASGAVAAPTFTANATRGSYIVTASSQYGSVSFSLTNTAAGIPARILAIPLKHRSATVMSRYPQSLQAKVLDARGAPVADATVTFTLGSGGSGGCAGASSSAASASFVGGSAQASASTGASGIATSPLFTANATSGSFTASAVVSDKEPSGGSGTAAGAAGAPTPASFSLSNRAGRAAKLTPGVGTMQSTPLGAAFPIGLAVTVTDAEKNPVAGALITFSAPAGGPSGRFTSRARGRDGHPRVAHVQTVKVKTGACGIAVAPTFTANDQPGGYVVKASVKHARPAAFALVNEVPGQSG
ncbi:MAG TPA: hypothetical protein VMB51_08425 [Solirubrobacteraceae bacterium]|nr:hypothetical protein [Solirubrobacteraceae bacterium]